MTEDAKEPDHAKGHRARLRKRFLDGGPDAVADYELLELLLFQAIPRRDVKPIAKALLAEFGSFAEVLAAAPARLAAVPHVGEGAVAALKVAEAAAVHLARGRVMGKPVLSSWPALLDYLTASMSFRDKEQFRLLYLDKKNQLIADDLQQEGTVDHTPVYPREIVKRALELGATAIILVHNHPSGDPTPSQADIEMTNAIVAAARPLNIVVHDHLIVGGKTTVSFRSTGLL